MVRVRQATAVIVYEIIAPFMDNFILSFVVLILLLAFDFWTVKVCTMAASQLVA